MVERHISMRGEVVDFNKLRTVHATKPALGNASMNARGDIINEKGIVLKTQEQIEADYAAKIAEQQEITALVDIKSSEAIAAAVNTVAAPAPVIEKKNINVDDANFEPDGAAKPRRKIVESD